MGRPLTDVLRPVTVPPRGRVVVLPHAGAGPNALLPLLGLLPPDLELVGTTLPGRERRFAEPFAAVAADPDGLVRAVLDELAARPALPTTLFGHSMGAALAGLAAQRAPGAFTAVVLSSYPLPGTPAELAGRWSEERLLRVLEAGGGTPAEVLANPAWRRHVLDLLRADLTLAVRLVHAGFAGPLAVPLVVLDGDSDLLVGPPDHDVWRFRAGAGLRRRVLPGGHFHLLDPRNRDAVVAELVGAGPAAAAA